MDEGKGVGEGGVGEVGILWLDWIVDGFSGVFGYFVYLLA